MCKCFVGAHRVILWSLYVILLASPTVSCDLDSLSDELKLPPVMIAQPASGAEVDAGAESGSGHGLVAAYYNRMGDHASKSRPRQRQASINGGLVIEADKTIA